MHTKTMEGIVGARTNINLLNTPFKVYKEARQKGDTETMKRAMGYVSEFADMAEEYKAQVDKGMKEDAKDAKEKAELERENIIRKSKEEYEELEKRMENIKKDNAVSDSDNSSETKTNTVKKESVIYTRSGEVSQSNLESDTSIYVAV